VPCDSSLSTTLTVLGRDISLKDANVVLIDGVDTGAPKLTAEPQLNGTRCIGRAACI